MKDFLSNLLEGSSAESFATYIKIVFILLVLFFAIREIVTWYYKINRIVELLESIDNKLSIQQFPVKNDVEVNTINLVNENEEKSDGARKPQDTGIKKVLTKKYYIRDIFSAKKR